MQTALPSIREVSEWYRENSECIGSIEHTVFTRMESWHIAATNSHHYSSNLQQSNFSLYFPYVEHLLNQNKNYRTRLKLNLESQTGENNHILDRPSPTTDHPHHSIPEHRLVPSPIYTIRPQPMRALEQMLEDPTSEGNNHIVVVAG